MRRVLVVFGVLAGSAFLGIFLLWYWLTPHKHAMVRKAESGDIQAMYEVGIAHLSISGKGIISPRSERDPVHWFRMAAKNGHAGAMFVLADLGIPNEEKVMWLKKGAELGNKACMLELSNSYLHQMHGLPKDIGAFLYWEARVSEVTMKENGETPERIAARLKEGEVRRRRDLTYDGPIRPLP